jgi:hypothetical protein
MRNTLITTIPLLLGLLLGYFGHSLLNDPMSKTLATYDGGRVTEGDLAKTYPDEYRRLIDYDGATRKTMVDRLLNQRLVEVDAKNRGMTLEQISKQFEARRAEPVSEDEYQTFVKNNPNSLAGKSREDIEREIQNVRVILLNQNYMQDLSKKFNVR